MRSALLSVVIVVLVIAALPQAQGTAPATPVSLLTRDSRRTVATTVLSGQELIALDDVATLFQVMVREDTLAGGITLTYRGRTVVASPDQPMASVNGRVVSLPSPAVRSGRRWLVPLEFLPRALGPIYDARIEWRAASRLLIVGDLRVPRVTVRIDAAGPPSRLTVDATPATTATSAIEAGRLTLRFEADALDLGPAPAASGLVDQVRAGDSPTAVIVMLSPRAGAPRVVTTTADDRTRISVEVPSTAPDSTAATPAPPAGTPLPDGTEAASPLAAVSRSALQTVVLDPGHGGDENGSRGQGGMLEKQIALDVARRVKALVETRLGIRVLMTRDDDRTVSLDERAAVANNNKADLFISFHLNFSLANAVAGAEVFHLRLDREGEEVRRRAAAEQIRLPVVGGGTRAIDVIRWDHAQAPHVEASSLLADLIAQELGKHVPMGPRPVQATSMRVLSGVNMPAAIIEMAYLSNREQERAAQSAEFQDRVSQAVYDAVLRFRASLEEQGTR